MGKTRSVMLETDDGRWELPVNPKEISVTQDSKDKTIDLLNVGEFNVPGNRGLIKVLLSTFLPDNSSPFYKGVDPEQIISSVKKAKNGKRPIRIIISGAMYQNISKALVGQGTKTSWRARLRSVTCMRRRIRTSTTYPSGKGTG